MFLRLTLILLTAFGLAISAHAQTRIVDGVPLPSDVSVSSPTQNNSFAGAWSGLWGHRLKHILVVENVQPDGAAEVVYAYGDMVSWGITKDFARYPAKIDGDELVVSGRGFVATYQKLPSGVLMANFQAGVQSVRSSRGLPDQTCPNARVTFF